MTRGDAQSRPRLGRAALVDQLAADGVRYLFGNPGTVEQGFLDEVERHPDVEYVLALQETVAIGIADGYARGTRRPGVVQLHTGVGLGNGIGMLYQAKRGRSPIVVLAGEAGIGHDAMDRQMAADLVAMARPVTKWATRAANPGSLLRVLRRAMKTAATPPMGPVYVSVPAHVLDAPNRETVVPTSVPVRRGDPPADQVARAADLLAGAARPVIVAGDGVAQGGAQADLARVAELLGAEVWGADWSEVNLPYGHPLFRGLLGHRFGWQRREVTAGADAVLICGIHTFPEVLPTAEGAFDRGARVVHIDVDDGQGARSHPVDLGLGGDPGPTLRQLAIALGERMTAEQRTAAGVRAETIGRRTREELERQRELDRHAARDVPLRMSTFASELARALPPGAVVFDEALTASADLTRYLQPSEPGTYHLTRGGSLGVGIPGAIGLKLAHPDRTVIGVTGDGGSMYTIQALWTAARHDVDVKLVICNNHSYELLKLNMQRYWTERGMPPRAFPSAFDLGHPNIQFSELARALGVSAMRMTRPEHVRPVLRHVLAHRGPCLLDVVLTSEEPSVLAIPGAART